MLRTKRISERDFSKELDIEDEISLKMIRTKVGVDILIDKEIVGYINSSYIYFDSTNVDFLDEDREKIAFFGQAYIGQIVQEISDEGEEWHIQLKG